jgi:ribokinase
MDVVATAERHPRVGETVPGKEVLYFPGGKGANQAVAAAKPGANAVLIARLGNDAFGAALRAFLVAQGVDVSLVSETDGAHTGTAIITLANADNTIVVIPTISAFFARARTAGATTILNPAPAREFGRELLDLVDVLVLNETELGLLAKAELREGDDAARFVAAARVLRVRQNQIICVTLGKRGVAALVDGETIIVPGRAVKAVDTTGAGDCFVGALAAQLALGTTISDALGYANTAASVSVQRMGAAPSMPTAAEVTSML